MPSFSKNICLGGCVIQPLSGPQSLNYSRAVWYSVCKVIHSVKTELTTLLLKMLWKNTTFRKLSVKTETNSPFEVASLMWKLNIKISALINGFGNDVLVLQ